MAAEEVFWAGVSAGPSRGGEMGQRAGGALPAEVCSVPWCHTGLFSWVPAGEDFPPLKAVRRTSVHQV